MTSELTLDKVQWEDEGIYSCLAKQVASKDEPTKQEIILEIFGKNLFFIDLFGTIDNHKNDASFL